MRREQSVLRGNLAGHAAIRLGEAVGAPLDLIRELGRINRAQWQLEDLCRVPGATVGAVAAVKHEIDKSNARRHRMIDLIDQHVQVEAIRAADARWYSETVGELCDRLLILDLKIEALLDAEKRPNAVMASAEHIAQVSTMLASDIREGRAILPPRTAIKIYNAATTAPTRVSTGLTNESAS